jgi:hypothetical protein
MLAPRFLTPMIALSARQVKTAVQPAHAPVEGPTLALACSIVNRSLPARLWRVAVLVGRLFRFPVDDSGDENGLRVSVAFPFSPLPPTGPFSLSRASRR